jgi:hypothetical protein
MSKVTINGSTGITGYKADNTTVEVNYTPAQLVTMKPSVFRSASPFIISGGLRVDASVYPPVLQYPDATENVLLSRDANLVSYNVESFGNGDQNHIMPSGIQANDVIIMVQTNGLRTGPGYGPHESVGNGFTNVKGNTTSAVAQWYWKPDGSNYDISIHQVSYKIASGNESNTTVGGFSATNQSNVGSPRGYRTVYVYRPTYSYSSITTSDSTDNTGANANSSFPSHQSSTSGAGHPDYATIGIVQYGSGNTSRTATLSGAVTSFDQTTSNNAGYASNTIFTGAFSNAAPTGTITASGASGQTVGDCVSMSLLKIIP